MSRSFGSLLKACRVTAKRSLGDLARELCVSPAYIFDVEKGARAPLVRDRILKAASFLGVSPDPLIIAAAEWKGKGVRLSLDPARSSERKRAVGAALSRCWGSLEEEDVNGIYQILARRGVLPPTD